MTRRGTYKPADRTGDVLLRMAPEERTELREKAKAAGLSVNEYVYRLIFGPPALRKSALQEKMA